MRTQAMVKVTIACTATLLNSSAYRGRYGVGVELEVKNSTSVYGRRNLFLQFYSKAHKQQSASREG